MSYCNCEYCGNSMQQGEKSITQFGQADICSSQCLMDANDDENTELPFRQFKQVGFSSDPDLKQCCDSANKMQEINNGK